jgi:hypothetical protein
VEEAKAQETVPTLRAKEKIRKKAEAKYARAAETARRKAEADVKAKNKVEEKARRAKLELAKEKQRARTNESVLRLTKAKLARTQMALEKLARCQKAPARGRKRKRQHWDWVQCNDCSKWRIVDMKWEEDERYCCGDNQRDCNEAEDIEDESIV